MTVLSETRYTPWGEVRYHAGTTSTGYTYTGQYNTADFGLMYYNARWYDPVLGRFTQADSIVPAGVQGYDRYAYVNNNPVRYTDPSGHCSKEGDDWCYDSPATPTPKPTPTATSTRTPIATSTPCSSPSNNCATQISAQVTYNAYNAYRCQNGAISCLEQIQPTSTPTPANTPQPTSELPGVMRAEINPSIIPSDSLVIPVGWGIKPHDVLSDLGKIIPPILGWPAIRQNVGDYFNGNAFVKHAYPVAEFLIGRGVGIFIIFGDPFSNPINPDYIG